MVRDTLLVKKANKDVFVLYATPAFSYEFPYGFSIDTECEYKIYRGYGDNYDRELYDWSVAVGKRFKMVSIALTVNDLLNQSVNFTHSQICRILSDCVVEVIGTENYTYIVL